MSKSCPISLRSIDSNLVRIISAQVSLVVMILLITKLPIFALILLFDFLARALRRQELSPFLLIGKSIVKILNLKENMCDEAPKRFALFMGLSISFTLSILYLINLPIYATIVSVILLICALLETMFDFCFGCKIYQILQLIKR